MLGVGARTRNEEQADADLESHIRPSRTMMMARCCWPKTMGWCWVLDPEGLLHLRWGLVAMVKLERCPHDDHQFLHFQRFDFSLYSARDCRSKT